MKIQLRKVVSIFGIILLAIMLTKLIPLDKKILAGNIKKNMERGTTDKNPIKILEIEPADTFKLTKSGGISIDPGQDYKNQIKIPIEENAIVEVNGKNKYVSITHLTMSEFISMIDEISGQYDAVVIGRENNMIERKDGNSQYGYFEWIGTEYNSTKKYRDYTNPLKDTNGKINNVFQEFTHNEVEYYSENDITKKRAEEIKKMYNSNQLVYMDVNIGIDEEYRDNVQWGGNSWDIRSDGAIHYPIKESNLYDLYNELNGCNKFSESESTTVVYPPYAQQINAEVIPKKENDISIEQILNDYEELSSKYKRPNVYDYERNIDENKFSITVNINEKEDVIFKLYIDKNGDGLFDKENEEIKNIKTKFLGCNNGVNQYEIIHNLNSSFWGYLGWKLEVIKKDDRSLIKTNIIDFDSVKRPDNMPKKEINILQIYPSYWYNGDVGNGNINEDALPKELVGNNNFKDLCNELSDDYIINIKRKRINDFNIEVLNDTDSFNNYSAVIIGFGKDDTIGSYNDGLSDKMIQDLKDYINSGKSIVFSADTMAQSIPIKHEDTSTLTQAFRDIIGQSRYIDPYNESELDLDGSKIYHDQLNDRSKYSAGVVADANNGNWNKPSEKDGKYYARVINRSQNTTYPFNLNNKRIEVSKYDRAQIYQLNLEDENVVPLYNIENDHFNTGDSRNFYHTYSKGNITYCASLPDFDKDIDDKFPVDELKLFMNSLVKSSDNSNNPPLINSMYMDNKISDGDIINLTEIKDGFTFVIEAIDEDNDNVELEVILDNDEEPFKSSNGFVASGTQLSVHIPKYKLNEAYISDDKKINISVIARDERGAISEENYVIDLSSYIKVDHGIYMGVNNNPMIDTDKKTFYKGSAVTFGVHINGICDNQLFTLKLGKNISNDTSYLEDNPKVYGIDSNNNLVDLSVEVWQESDKIYTGKINNIPGGISRVLVIYTEIMLSESSNYINTIKIGNGAEVPATVRVASEELPDLF